MHNSGFFYKNIDPCTDFNRTTAYPGGIDKESYGWDEPHVEALLRTKEFYDVEKKYIDEFQNKDHCKNRFFFIKYHMFHGAVMMKKKHKVMARDCEEECCSVAMDHLADLMKYWNWDEPDSLFYVMSDHGDYKISNNGEWYPQLSLTWAYVKGISVNNNLWIGDFHKIVESFIKGENELIRDDKYYYSEDSRASVSKKASTTFMVFEFLDKNMANYLLYDKINDEYGEFVINVRTLEKKKKKIDEKKQNQLIEYFFKIKV